MTADLRDTAYLLTGMPVVESPHLLVGTEPLTREQRIARAARHEARLICRARARELGYDCPDPDDSALNGHLPADHLQAHGSRGWRWPNLDDELHLRELAIRQDLDRLIAEHAAAWEEWSDRPYAITDRHGYVRHGSAAAASAALDRGETLALRPGPSGKRVGTLIEGTGFILTDLS